MEQKDFGRLPPQSTPNIALPDVSTWESEGMRHSLQEWSYDVRFKGTGVEGNWWPGAPLWTLSESGKNYVGLYSTGNVQEMCRMATERKIRRRAMLKLTPDEKKKEMSKLTYFDRLDEKLDDVLTDMTKMNELLNPVGSMFSNLVPFNQFGRTKIGYSGYNSMMNVAVNPEKHVVNFPDFFDCPETIRPTDDLWCIFKPVSFKVAAPFTNSDGRTLPSVADDNLVNWDLDTVPDFIFTVTRNGAPPPAYDDKCIWERFTQPPLEYSGYKWFDEDNNPHLATGIVFHIGKATQPHIGNSVTATTGLKMRRTLADAEVKKLRPMDIYLDWRKQQT